MREDTREAILSIFNNRKMDAPDDVLVFAIEDVPVVIEEILNALPDDNEIAKRLWRRYEATLQREGHLVPRGGFPAFLKTLDREDK